MLYIETLFPESIFWTILLMTCWRGLSVIFAMNTGKFGTHEGLTGRLSTGLGCWPRSCIYLGCRVGRSRKEGTVYVLVCVSDVMDLSYDAIRLVDVRGGVISNGRNEINDINRFVFI